MIIYYLNKKYKNHDFILDSIMIQITKDNFKKEVEKSKKPVIVDFWAEWCGPCKTLGPIFEEASKSFDGKVKFAKLDVENNQELAVQFGVMSIPSMIIFKGGKEINRIVGAISLDKLIGFVEKNLL